MVQLFVLLVLLLVIFEVVGLSAHFQLLRGRGLWVFGLQATIWVLLLCAALTLVAWIALLGPLLVAIVSMGWLIFRAVLRSMDFAIAAWQVWLVKRILLPARQLVKHVYLLARYSKHMSVELVANGQLEIRVIGRIVTHPTVVNWRVNGCNLCVVEQLIRRLQSSEHHGDVWSQRLNENLINRKWPVLFIRRRQLDWIDFTNQRTAVPVEMLAQITCTKHLCPLQAGHLFDE